MNESDRFFVVLGAGGMLGTALSAALRRRPGRVAALTRADLDLTDGDAVRARLADLRPDVVFNCAAFTRVDECESNEPAAMRINADAPGAVAQTARGLNARFVHLSTDYVFAGDRPAPYRESDPPGPPEALCVYGRSKLLGEQQVAAAGGRWLIVRTSWLFGPAGPNFVATILKLARTRPELRVVDDQRGRPTYASDLADALIGLCERGAEGIVHVANAGACTWFEFAREIVRRAGLATPVHPCRTEEFPRPARRPANSVLDTTRFEHLAGRRLRPWADALADYLKPD